MDLNINFYLINPILHKRNLPFWLLTMGIMIALILPKAIQDGMFMDGVLYASISNNLVNGIGSFWFLEFSEHGFAGFETFHEHPPFVFWIQAGFFKVFGSSMYVERFYSFLMAVLTAILIARFWKNLHTKEKDIAELNWLPVLLWIIIPVAFWSFQNNVMENTMSIFTLLAVFFAFQFLHFKKHFIYLILSGLMIFAASFSKGVPGLFPLGVAFLHWIIFRKHSFGKMVIYSLVLLIVPTLIYSLILLIPEANASLSIYFYERLLGRVEGKHTVDHHYYILIRLFMELLPLIIISVLALVVFKLKKVNNQLHSDRIKMIGFFMLIGLSGSVPLMLTLVQKTFYFGAALPFFGIAFAMIIAPGFSEFTKKIDTKKTAFKLFAVFSSLIIVTGIVVTFFQVGKFSRNKDVLHDMYAVKPYIPEHSTINVHPKMWDQWDMHCYMVRYYHISWDPHFKEKHNYLLLDKKLKTTFVKSYTKIELSTRKFDLYQLVEN